MSLGPADLAFLADCASRAAEGAGDLIASARPSVIRHKPGLEGASEIVTDIDRKAEELILEALTPANSRYDLGVLSEECGDDGSRHSKEFFWCVDPLDGTLPFVEGKPGYAVSIALVSRAGTPVVGVVVDPVGEVVYRAVRDQGVLRNGQLWDPASFATTDTLGVFADRSLQSRPDYTRVLGGLEAIAEAMGLQGAQVHIGAGAVLNACQVLGSAPACYFKFPKADNGGGSLWDFAATACLFAEAGAIATDMLGSQLDLNRDDSTFMNHRGVVFATDAELARHLRALNSL